MVQDLYILMITAGVVSLLFKLMKQPVVLGYIVAGVLVGQWAKLDMMNSLFLAGMLCMSSTTIVMKAVDEAGLGKERSGRSARQDGPT